MEHTKQQELSGLASHQIKLAQDYATQRQLAGELKTQLELMLVADLEWIRAEKSNVGYEMAMLMLLERNKAAKLIYQEFRQAESKYKGLEKLVDAHQSKISLEQSVMRYVSDGEKYS